MHVCQELVTVGVHQGAMVVASEGAMAAVVVVVATEEGMGVAAAADDMAVAVETGMAIRGLVRGRPLLGAGGCVGPTDTRDSHL